jgi:hypothetical protein
MQYGIYLMVFLSVAVRLRLHFQRQTLEVEKESATV